MHYPLRLIPLGLSPEEVNLLRKIAEIGLEFVFNNQEKAARTRLDARFGYSQESAFFALDCLRTLQEFIDANPDVPLIPMPQIGERKWLGDLLSQRLIAFLTKGHTPYSKTLTKLVMTGAHDIGSFHPGLSILVACHDYLSTPIGQHQP